MKHRYIDTKKGAVSQWSGGRLILTRTNVVSEQTAARHHGSNWIISTCHIQINRAPTPTDSQTSLRVWAARHATRATEAKRDVQRLLFVHEGVPCYQTSDDIRQPGQPGMQRTAIPSALSLTHPAAISTMSGKWLSWPMKHNKPSYVLRGSSCARTKHDAIAKRRRVSHKRHQAQERSINLQRL